MSAATRVSSAGRQPIAIVIPCFNLGATVEEAVDSALDQTRPPQEIFVVDDGSDDAFTRDVLTRLARPHTRLVRQKNAGVANARSAGINLSTAPLIVCLDADDALAPEYLERVAARIEDKPELDFVSTAVQAFEGASYTWTPPSLTVAGTLTRGSVHMSSMFTRRLWATLRGFDPELAGYEDMDFWLRALEHGFKGEILPDPLLLYRVRQDSRYRRALAPDNYRAIMRRLFDLHRSTLEAEGTQLLLEKASFLEEIKTYRDSLVRRRDALRRELGTEVPLGPPSSASMIPLAGPRFRTAPRVYANRGVVLAYHRIGSLSPDTYGLCVSAEHFREQMEWIRSTCTVLPLSGLVAAARAGAIPPRAVAVTFDDGYLDGLTTVAPILASLDIPATFFINTERLEERHEAWHDELERLVLGTPEAALLEVQTAAGWLAFETDSRERRLRALMSLHRRCVGATRPERDALLDQVRGWSGVMTEPRDERRLLLDAEVLELSRMPGMEIGSHTDEHLLLTAHGPELWSAQIENAKARLELLVGKPVSAFCYPYGAHDRGIAAAVQPHHSYAVTTEPGAVTLAVDPMLVPRLEMDDAPASTIAVTIDAVLANDTTGIVSRTYAWPGSPADEARRTNDARSEEEYARRELTLVSRPTFLIVDPSSRCNARCVMCPVSFREPTDHGTDLPRPVFESVRSLMPTARHINLFSSGEPTIARDIEAMVAAAREDSNSDAAIWVSTNGKRLPERVLDLLIAPRIGLQFSVDGGTKEVFEAIRRGILFEELRESLRRVTERKGTRPYPALAFSTTLSKRNIHDLSNIFTLAAQYGVGHVHFYEEDPEVPAEEAFALDESDRPVLDAQMPAILDSGITFSSEMYFRGAQGLRATEPPIPDDPPRIECRAPWKVFHQRADGRVLPCCTLRRSMGDTTRQTVDEIWNGPEYVALRRAFAEQQGIPGTCYRCVDPLRNCQ